MINVSRPFNIYQIIRKAKIYFDNSNLITNYEIKQLDVSLCLKPRNFQHHCILFNRVCNFGAGYHLSLCLLWPPFTLRLCEMPSVLLYYF